MAVLPHPPQFENEPGDKVQHIAAFVTLAILGSLGFPFTKPWKLLLWLSLFGAGIEVVQAIPMLHRDSDIVDWAADTLAAGLAVGAFAWARSRNHQRQC
jgi:VanZ family protein